MTIYYKNLNTQCVPFYVRKNCNNNNNNKPENESKITNKLKTLDFENQISNPLFLNLHSILKRKYLSDFSILNSLNISNNPTLTKGDIITSFIPNNKLVKLTISLKYLLNIIRIIKNQNLLFYGCNLFHYLPNNNILIDLPNNQTRSNAKSPVNNNFTIVTSENISIYFKKYTTSTTPIFDYGLLDSFKQLLKETDNLELLRNLSSPMTVVPLATTETPPNINVNEIVSTVETELTNNVNNILYPTISNYLASKEKTFNYVYDGELLVKNTDTSVITFSISEEKITFENANLEVLLNITDGIIDNEMNVNQSSVVISKNDSQYTVTLSFKSFITIKNIKLTLDDENQPHPLEIIFNLKSLKISNTSIIYVTLNDDSITDIFIDNVIIDSLSEADVNDNIEVVSANYNNVSQNFSKSQIDFIFNTTLLYNLIDFTSKQLVSNFEGGSTKYIYFDCKNIIKSVPTDFTNYINSKLSSITSNLPNYISSFFEFENTCTEVEGEPTDTGDKVGGNKVKVSFNYDTLDYESKDGNGNNNYNISKFSEFSNTNLTVDKIIIFGTKVENIFYSNLTTDNVISFSNIESNIQFKAEAGDKNDKVKANYKYNVNNVNITYIPADPNNQYFVYSNNKISKATVDLSNNNDLTNNTIKDIQITPNTTNFYVTFELGGVFRTYDMNTIFRIEELVPIDIKDNLNPVSRNILNYSFTFSSDSA